jgi:thioredoxin 1
MEAIALDTFDAVVLRSTEPVIVDFWGPRCAPCLALMPHVETLAEEYRGRVKVVKADASENRELCIRLRVMKLPTFVAFADGVEVARRTGDVNAGELREWVEGLLVRPPRISKGNVE